MRVGEGKLGCLVGKGGLSRARQKGKRRWRIGRDRRRGRLECEEVMETRKI